MNHGRQGSSAVRWAIHAPLTPNNTSTSGTTQHTDAPIAASNATITAGKDDLAGIELMRAY